MVYTNRSLLNWPEGKPRTDDLFVVTRPPEQENDITHLRIDLDDTAAALDSCAGNYPSQPTVREIREGTGEKWLLSGGTLITNHEKQIAIGLRDGNAADRFLFTNIGAGRCDQMLKDHCYEERDTEFILCVKKKSIWHQITFGSDTRLLQTLNKPAVNNKILSIVEFLDQSNPLLSPPSISQTPISTKLTGTISVNWCDKSGICAEENLKGYVFLDYPGKTTEFRLAMQFDLSSYEDVQIFYGEGTGHAEWQSLDNIRLLVKAESIAKRHFVTPFLRQL